VTVSRRSLLTGAAAGLGAIAGAGAVAIAHAGSVPAVFPENPDFGTASVPFHGPRQAGVTTEPPAHAAFVAFTLHRGTDRNAIERMLRLLTDDAARLTRGEAALGDTDATLAVLPARLTVTFGFGPGLYRAAGTPAPIADLPAFTIDRLEPAWSGGDLLLQICADDPLTVTHTQRMLIKDTRPFGAVRWVQQGFRRGRGVEAAGLTQRNILGQLDGTANPQGAVLDAAVWQPSGGTTLVLRRIRAELEKWDLLSVADKENAIGRHLDSGAPLSGGAEPDFTALDADGLPLMPDYAHVTRAHVTEDRLRILRRPYNYDGAPNTAGNPDTGLIFAAYQADINRQYVPIQRRLAERDLLNQWITPIGSAVFAIPPGCPEGGWIGEQSLT
jgi:dye decolorizing peroxidase